MRGTFVCFCPSSFTHTTNRILIDSVSDRPQAEVYGHARDRAIWDVSWHPLGHVLATVGHDHMCKFWARNRPGDPMAKDANEYEQASLIGTYILPSAYYYNAF